MFHKNLYLIAKIFIGILIIISLSQTYRLMQNHFTHIDDISVAYRFIKEDFFNRACDSNIAKPAGSAIHKIMGEDKERFCKLYYYAYIYTVIPRNFTYAPFQFWLTQAFLKPEQSYSYLETKLQGRLPSFIFHVLGLILFLLLILRKIPGLKDEKLIPYILVLVAAFSLEQRIMASQMHSYAIGILSNVCALYGILRAQNFLFFSKKQLFTTGLILALSVAMHYQAILLVTAGFLSTALIQFNRQNLKDQLKKYLLLSVFFIIGLGLTGAIIIIRYSSGINWNAGPNAEFIITSTDFIKRVIDFLNLLFHESSHNIYSISSAIEFESTQAASFFGSSVLLICFLGLIFLFKKRRQPEYGIYFYTLFVYLLIYFTLVFIGKLSHSPTRHFLFYLPCLLILTGYGFLFLKSYLNKIFFDISLFLYVLFYGIIAINLFSTFEEKRRDIIQVYNIPELFDQSGATQFLLDQFDIEPFFIPELANKEIFRYRPKPLCKDHIDLATIALPTRITIFWYSKRVILNNQGEPVQKASHDGGPIADYFKRVLEDCRPNTVFQNQDIKVEKLADILLHHSDVEIDLSHRTKNGSNSLFLQTFDVQLPAVVTKN